jgi:alanine dehydrogenase
VGLTPDSVKKLISQGHELIVETDAGYGSGFSDGDYLHLGAKIVKTPKEVFDSSDLIVKVKEPQTSEIKLLKSNQILFTYLHLAANKTLTQGLIESNAICIAYETVTNSSNGLPLLAPMSEVAGKISIQAGAHALEKTQEGRGVLMAGATGAPPADVVIIGCGVVGFNAALIAVGMGANVYLIDKSKERLAELSEYFGDKVNTVISSEAAVEKHVTNCDLLVGGVLVPGSSAPMLVSEKLVSKMRKGSAIVDVAIDQGGCIETSKPTTHSDPTYIYKDIVHYCVTNMPGCVPRTSTIALNNATLPFISDLANKGYKKALNDDHHFMNGLNIIQGKCTQKEVAHDLGYNYINPNTILN